MLMFISVIVLPLTLVLLGCVYINHRRLVAKFSASLEQIQNQQEELKLTNASLQDLNDLFNLFMDHSPVYAFIKEVTPVEGRVLLASENFVRMIGLSGSEMVGKTMTELFPAELAAKIIADDWDVVSSGKVLELDEALNGRHYTSIKFPLVQKGKTLLAGYTIDITERKILDEELRAEKQKLLKTLSISDHYQAQLQEMNSRIRGMAEVDERSRLYRDLHDGAGQSLHAVCLHLKMMADGRGGFDDPKLLAAQLAREVADVASEMREIAHQLRPSYLQDITLDAAIIRRCEMLGRRGVPVVAACSDDFAALPQQVSDNVYRIAQEAISNAARHAGAEHIVVSLTRSGATLRLAIDDDGCGMKDSRQGIDGMGLRIMKERAALIGATFNIESSNAGTSLTLILEKI